MSKAPFANCDECTLINSIFVPSEVHNSHIVVLVEAPGYNETQEGRPLVGTAGQDLNDLLEEMNIERGFATYINSVSCRPTKLVSGVLKNRTPTDDEIMWCSKRLKHELDIHNPLVIIAMGKTAYMAAGGEVYKGFKMGDVVGTSFLYEENCQVLITYHPAALSHAGGSATLRGRMIKEAIKDVIKEALRIRFKERQLTLGL